MTQQTYQTGASLPIVLGAITALAIVGGLTFYFMRTSAPVAVAPTPLSTSPVQTSIPPDTAQPATDAQLASPDNTPSYSGTVLAGTDSPLIDFNQADFEAAQEANQLIVLYFYANWCPECRAEFPKMEAAFNSLSNNQVVGFRVNFKDNETNADEVALARDHGVAYQHTKVIVKNGQQLLKSPETWEQERYVNEINQIIASQ